jgi:hypothetical protein
MREISTSDLFQKQAVCRVMAGLGFVVLLVMTFFSTGCSKHKSPVAQTAIDQNTNQTAVQPPVPVYEQPSTANPSSSAQPPAAPDLKELNRNLLRWILGNRRRPQNFEEFAATANVPIPPPPAGKKYVLGKDMHIQLVDR